MCKPRVMQERSYWLTDHGNGLALACFGDPWHFVHGKEWEYYGGKTLGNRCCR